MYDLLKGLRVVEGSAFVAGPTCGLYLAQLGAEVIRFDNIGGLKPRAPVKSAGVTVGRVSSISLDGKTFQGLVTMELEKRFAFPKDTSAAILTAGLLGDQYVGLNPGGDSGPGTQRSSQTNQCHDITVYPEVGLAAGACSGNGIIMDISDPANPKRLDLRPEHARAAINAGVRLCISSDAHRPEGLDVLRYGVDTARRGWATKADIVNTRTWPQIRKLRKRG